MLDSPVEEIKSRLNILDLVQDFVQLKKAGTNYKGICPFHNEKSPSFMVSPSKQIWHCFGCGLGGDVFEFIKQIEHVEFAEALKILAARTGVELRKPTATEVEASKKKDVLYEINRQAATYFAKVLWDSNAGKDALEYLRQRGLTDQTIKNWQLGFAPDDFHYLENFLAKTFDKKDIEQAGLIIKSDKGPGYFDRFHDRIMFPIINLHGQVVGFTGRLLHDKPNAGKYVNSPETPIYNKSREVYGLYQGKNTIRKNNRAVVVEGNMDVIASHQAGVSEAVATSGTALAQTQLDVLQRFTENLVFAFDSDSAGTTAARRALELALNQGFNVRITNLGPFKDPDELIKKGIGLWQKTVEGAGNFLDYFFDLAFRRPDSQTPEGKREIARELTPLIVRINDSITRAHYVRKLAVGLNVAETAVWDIINKLSRPKPIISKQEPPNRKKSRKEVLSDQILGLSLLLSNSQYLAETGLAEPEDQSRKDYLRFAAETAAQEQNLDPKLELPKLTAEYLRLIIQEQMKSVADQITAAEKAGDEQKVKQLSQAYVELSNRLKK